jgi:hypothetical protein
VVDACKYFVVDLVNTSRRDDHRPVLLDRTKCQTHCRNQPYDPVSHTVLCLHGLGEALGLLIGAASLFTSWNPEPRWYEFALLAVYAPSKS